MKMSEAIALAEAIANAQRTGRPAPAVFGFALALNAACLAPVVASSAAASYAAQAAETSKLASIGIAKAPQSYADRLAEFGARK